MPQDITIYIAEDQQIFRHALRVAIEVEKGFQVLGEASNGRQAIKDIRRLRPSVVIMDIAMPELNGIEATRQITAENLPSKVIALSMHADAKYVMEMLEAGASGYLLKDNNFDELINCVKQVSEDNIYLCPEAQNMLVVNCLRKTVAKMNATGNHTILTNREREILQLIAEGHTNKSIAETLSISLKTVESHRSQIVEKLGIRDVASLTKFAIKHGITFL